MDVLAPGFWLVPTRGRVESNLPRLLNAIRDMRTTTAGYIVVDQDDYGANVEAYDTLDLPERWTLYVVPGGGSGVAFEQARAALWMDDQQWIGFLSDDLIPETPEWDVKTLAWLAPFAMVSTNDGAFAPKRFNGATVWGADYVRALGYVYPPGLKHMFIDDIHEELGRATGLWHCEMSIMVRHYHHSFHGRSDRISKRADAFFAGDSLRFQEWRRTEKAPAIDRIMTMLKEHGIEVSTPDLRGVSVMIATPTGDGTFEGVFQRSYVETRDAIRQFGGECYLAQAPYISDISLARMKLFGAFLRSNATHCFWIDADQGWQVRDFLRCLRSGKDFCAVAGIQKTAMPNFAVNNTDDYGNPVRIHHSSPDGLMMVTHVGFAFACVTHHWADRMSQSYVDLECRTPDGATEYGIFLPMIRNKRYLGEDFACTQRWRDIGGEVWIAPEGDLEHVGKKVWSGAWMTELARQAQQAAA